MSRTALEAYLRAALEGAGLAQPTPAEPDTTKSSPRAGLGRTVQQWIRPTAKPEDLRALVSMLVPRFDRRDVSTYPIFPVGSIGPHRNAFLPELEGTKVVNKRGIPRPVFHGSASRFEEFDPNTASKSALAGPGFYFTEHPGVASSYALRDPDAIKAWEKVRNSDRVSKRLLERQQMAEQEMARPWRHGHEPETELRHWRRVRDAAHSENAKQEAWRTQVAKVYQDWTSQYFGMDEAPNVHAAYLNIRNPFDIDEPLKQRMAEQLADIERRRVEHGIGWQHFEEGRTHAFSGPGPGSTVGPITKRANGTFDFNEYGSNVARWLMENDGAGERAPRMGWNVPGLLREHTQAVLREAGYDGMTHVGGKRIGTNQPHRVWIAYDPEQIIPAFGRPSDYSPAAREAYWP